MICVKNVFRARRRARLGLRFLCRSRVGGLLVGAWLGGIPVLAGPLHEAAESGSLPKLKSLLARDPGQLQSLDAKGRTVLARAALSGKRELVEFLLEKGATEDVYAAAVVGHVDKVRAFLKQDPKLVNTPDAGGKTPLHWAALYGQKAVAELLLAEKAAIDLHDGVGFAPLHWAVMFDHGELVTTLLANKADRNIKVPKFGWTPLRLAVIHGHAAVAEILLNAGVDPNAPESDDIPLLHQAVLSSRPEIAELLLAKKAAIEARDSEGDTALDEALETKNQPLIDLLRKHGAQEKK